MKLDFILFIDAFCSDLKQKRLEDEHGVYPLYSYD